LNQIKTPYLRTTKERSKTRSHSRERGIQTPLQSYIKNNEYSFLKNRLKGSGETDVNLYGSLPNHENRKIFDGTQPQGFSEARGARVFWIVCS
jgi:hypothetical protein